MICKEDVFRFLNLVRNMYGKVDFKYVEGILNILEHDSGKIWSKELKQKCLDMKVSLESIWENILNSPEDPNN